MKNILILAALLLSAFSTQALAFDFILEGKGVSRPGYENCNKALPQFEKLLQKTFVQILDKPRCVLDSNTAFVPEFKVLASKPYVTRKIAGAPFSSRSFCEIELQRMMKENAKKSPILEGACTTQDLDESLFKPELILLLSEGLNAE